MSHTLLIIDDKDLTRSNLVLFFALAGYSVAQASTGEAALELISQQAFDVVISDLRLPGILNGLDVLKHHSRIRPESGLVLLTAFGSSEVQSEAEALGAVYCEKPIDLIKLRATVDRFPTRPSDANG